MQCAFIGLCLTTQNAAVDLIPVWPCLVDEVLFSFLVLPHWRDSVAADIRNPQCCTEWFCLTRFWRRSAALTSCPWLKLQNGFGVQGWVEAGARMYLHSCMTLSRLCRYEQKDKAKPTCSGLNSYLQTRKRFIWKSCARCVINLQCFQSTVCFVMVLMPLMQSQHIIHLLHIKCSPAFHMLLFPRAYYCDSASVIFTQRI